VTSAWLLVVISLAVAPLGVASARAVTPRRGIWEGTTPAGVRVSFEVRPIEGGRRVIASPVLLCPGIEYFPGDYVHPVVDDIGAIPFSGERAPEVVTPIASSGRFSYGWDAQAPDVVGDLGARRGTVRSASFSALGCKLPRVEVHWVTADVRADGVYEGIGSFFTVIKLSVYSGGGVVAFDSSTYLGGVPVSEPDTGAVLVHAASPGLLAGATSPRATERGAAELPDCVGTFDLGPVRSSTGQFRIAGRFVDPVDLIGSMAIEGAFTGPDLIFGTYLGASSLEDLQACELGGEWVALSSGAPRMRWPEHFTADHGPPRRVPPKLPLGGCLRVHHIVEVGISDARYPDIVLHIHQAIVRGWPRVLIINRPGATARRNRALRGIPIVAGEHRDEYPPAMLRGRGPGLERGRDPTGWEADIESVPAYENIGAGASTGNTLKRYCNGQRVALTGY